MVSLNFGFLRAVLWDWQGTIIDESGDILRDSLLYLKKIRENRRISQGVITNGDGIEIRAECICKDLAGYFDLGIISKSDGYLPKPSTQMFREILKPLKRYHPMNILFIGDSMVDKLMSEEAGCQFVYPWDLRDVN